MNLIAAACLLVVGIGVPIGIAGGHADVLAPYLAVGFVAGLIWAGSVFALLRPVIASLLLVVGIFGAMILFTRVLDGWDVALLPWITSSFAGSVFGAHLRWMVERRRA
ncbi:MULTISPECIES: hypothetical protein [unclassified Curtobacterium]|uniref:hypothetical protein n=1 Tax=unclassified Curtobacterium TaxID=257496 RepID=UPI0025B3796E|nr:MULTISPECIES: hypothetical protein [unclassified Curtobacterium]MDN3479239.1 hypothetical protein [Curtobacterium sp. APC 4022]MDN4648198.1 hypothetical protein [Curtobacterium sp. PsM8]